MKNIIESFFVGFTIAGVCACLSIILAAIFVPNFDFNKIKVTLIICGQLGLILWVLIAFMDVRNSI